MRFSPLSWLGSPHAQTVAGSIGLPPGRRGERVEIPVEGGRLVARLQRARPQNDRLIVVLHGAAGTGDEPFVVRTANKLASRGFDALRIALRGGGESAACSPPVFHGGLTEDVSAVVAWGLSRYAQLGIVGFSLGGQLALRTACAWSAAAPVPVMGIVAISPPLDLARSSRFLDRPAATPYRAMIMARLRAQYAAGRHRLPPSLARLEVRSFLRTHSYNEALVAPLFGFRDADEYYSSASSLPRLRDVTIPVLVVHAKDDPIVPVGPAVEAQRAAPRNIEVVITDRGGHVGFVADKAAPGDPDRFWAENRAVGFFETRPSREIT